MKKTLLIVSVLLVAVVSTACINNFAVRDLNNKAQSYMQQGDYPQAIERLKSSLDLDPNVYETHYNLAIAYTKAEDYLNASEQYEKALELKPNEPDVFYSLATAQNNLAIDIEQGRIRLNVDGKLYKPNPDEIDFNEKYEMSEKEQEFVAEYKKAAVLNYQKYLELNQNAQDKDEVEKQIEVLTKENTPEAKE
ncbi:tetratricopeptide repeat protein [bacterium]|nr:tetratricopeptide repeat protein [bacterium]